jgi:hypothetical protein
VLVVFPAVTDAYVTRSPGGLTEPWSPSLKVTPEHKSTTTTPPSTTTTTTNPPSIVDQVFRDEYETWANKYDKVMSTYRFEIFKQNFMLQMQQNKRLGTFHLLNEFGDLTQVEYEKYLTTGIMPTLTPSSTYSSSTSFSSSPTSSTTHEILKKQVLEDRKPEQSQPPQLDKNKDGDVTAAAVQVEVELVSETEDELRRRHQQERRGGPTRVEPLFTNHDNVARSRGGAVPGSLNNDARTTTSTRASSSSSSSSSYSATSRRQSSTSASASSSYYPYSSAPTPPGPQFREKYRTGGTQFLGVKKRLVRWMPGMPL